MKNLPFYKTIEMQNVWVLMALLKKIFFSTAAQFTTVCVNHVKKARTEKKQPPGTMLQSFLLQGYY